MEKNLNSRNLRGKLWLVILVTICFSITSCGGTESSGHQEDYSYESTQSGRSNLVLNSSHDVITALSHQSFRSDKGEKISFGSSASSVSVNGKEIGGAVKVLEIGTDSDDGVPYAMFSFSSPYISNVTFMLTELFGKIVIIDAEDPSYIFYKQ